MDKTSNSIKNLYNPTNSFINAYNDIRSDIPQNRIKHVDRYVNAGEYELAVDSIETMVVLNKIPAKPQVKHTIELFKGAVSPKCESIFNKYNKNTKADKNT